MAIRTGVVSPVRPAPSASTSYGSSRRSTIRCRATVPASRFRRRAECGVMVQPAVIVGLDDPRWSKFVSGSRDRLRSTTLPGRGSSRTTASRRWCSHRSEGTTEAGIPVLEVQLLRTRRWIALPFQCLPSTRRRSCRARRVLAERLQPPSPRGRRGSDGWKSVHCSKAHSVLPFGNAVTHTLDLDPDTGLGPLQRSRCHRFDSALRGPNVRASPCGGQDA